MAHTLLIKVLIMVYGIDSLNESKDLDLFFSRPPAIQNHFNLLSYFHAWYQEFSPVRNKNAYALFNDKHVINRDQI